MVKYIYLSLLFFILGCKVDTSENITNKLIGSWENSLNTTIIFTPDGYFYEKFQDFDLPTKIVKKINGEKIEVDYGILKFNLKKLGEDSFDLKLYGSKNGLLYLKYKLLFLNNRILLIGYKSLPGIENHIDEISWFMKVNENNKYNKNKEKIIIPKGFNKPIYIAYNQNEGQKLILDSAGNRLLYIPENGLLKTKFKENPEILAFQNYEFYEKDINSEQLIRMREFQYEDYMKLQNELIKNRRNIIFKYNPDSTAIFVLGFNQAPREVINDIFKEKIIGNVLMMEINTIRKQFNLNDPEYK